MFSNKNIENVNNELSKNNTKTDTTILLVEDNTDLRNYIELILSPHYQVITAEDDL